MDEVSFFDERDYEVVPKGWGKEVWVTNNSLYCGKLLFLDAGKKLSWHFHIVKDEVIFVQFGSVIFRYGANDDISTATEVSLRAGQSVRISPGIRHQLQALESSQLLEFSTQHFDHDSVRVLKGD